MIKPEELRIGNILQRDGLIFSAGHIQSNFYGELVNHEGFIGVEAIPLTQEWLVKLGFEKVSHYTYAHLKERQMSVCFYENLYTCYRDDNDMGNDLCKSVKYVHQLQNLFYCITEEELEVKSEGLYN